MSFDFNILDIDINIPSEDIRDYTIFIDGHPGCGKTSFVKQIPGSFTIDSDRGTKSHAMMKQEVHNWNEALEVKKQLVQANKMNKKALKAKEDGEKEVEIKVGKRKVILPVDVAIAQTSKIKFVSLDVVNVLKQYVKDFIIEKKNLELLNEGKGKQVSTFNELGWGKDDQLEKELMDYINDLRDNGYGVAIISHIKDKKYNRDTEDEFIKVVPDLQDNERNYLVGAADIEIQIDVEDVIIEKAEKKNGKVIKPAVTEQKTWMYLRANSERAAKSRFKYLPERIEYGYENLVEAVKEAVRKEIEYGKSIYNMDDDKVNELKNKQEEEKKKRNEEIINEIDQEEEQKKQEEGKQLFENTVKKIESKAKELTAIEDKDEKSKVLKKVKNIIGNNGDTKKISNVETAKAILDKLENFELQ